MSYQNLALYFLAIIFTTLYFLQKDPQMGIIAFGGWFMSSIVTIGENVDAWPQATFFAGMALVVVSSMVLDYAGARKVDFWG